MSVTIKMKAIIMTIFKSTFKLSIIFEIIDKTLRHKITNKRPQNYKLNEIEKLLD